MKYVRGYRPQMSSNEKYSNVEKMPFTSSTSLLQVRYQVIFTQHSEHRSHEFSLSEFRIEFSFNLRNHYFPLRDCDRRSATEILRMCSVAQICSKMRKYPGSLINVQNMTRICISSSIYTMKN